MFKNKKEVFSIRKFKDGRSDSVKIGAIALLVGTSLAVSGNIVQAKEITNRMDDSSLVSDTSNVDSSKSTTFVDSTNTDKKVTVDAVLDGGVAEPTKANNNNGEKDGTDSLNIKSETNVNYYLEEDNSKLKETTKVETGTGTISTDYDKKGIASDVDGKDYRESIRNKDGITVSEETGKEDVIKANGKAYKLKRSEVVDKDKVKYDKTTFNDIEAKVSPEGLHTSLGEIDYTKLSKKKVYLVEETSDGHYGKFVEVSGVTSDEDAVAKWKSGEATAKEFTKENVTLEDGDSILVLDKDTYATTTTVEKKKKRTGDSYTYEAIYNKTEDNNVNDISAITYTINRNSFETIRDIGEDGIFGTSDDKDVQAVPNPSLNGSDNTKPMTVVDVTGREDKSSTLLPKTPELNISNASIKDILKDIYAANYKVVDYLLSKAEKQEDIEKINSVKSNLDTKVNEIVSFMSENNISVGLTNRDEIGFYVKSLTPDTDEDKLNKFENKIKEFNQLLDGLPIIKNEVSSTKEKWNEFVGYEHDNSGLPPVTKTISEQYGYTPDDGLFSKRTTEIFRDSGWAISWQSWNESESNVNLSNTLPAENLNITVSDNKENVVLTHSKDKNDDIPGKSSNPAQEHDEYTSTIVKKEIISPIRAYNVVSDGTATVNHYYDLKLEPEALKETIETKGKAIVKYVDADGNEIKADETLVPETTIKTVKKYETKSDVTVISTREEVENNETAYNATTVKEDIIEKDGKRYKLNKVLEASDKYNNTASETGNLTEGTTTIVYQYDYLVPVDPTKPHEGQTNPPSPDDKIPNDPLNRSYKDLGLLKEVKRDITYVYENGPKAGQEASAPVNQKARFTRTAEINSRTGEVTYRTEWTPGQNLNEVVSPVKDKYAVDKEKVDTLSVTHESEDSAVVVKYTENPEVIDHDEAKDKKGTVIVKLIDDKGELLKEETIKNNVTVATATTKVYADRDPETTYTPTNEEYSTVDKKVPIFEKDGKKYKLNKLVEVSPELNNSIDETGKVKEGTTTIVYQYDYLVPVDPTKPHEGETNPPQPEDKVPNDPQNRSYKDLGLTKEVKRDITYVYENGPKAGQEASAPVNQKARFTRTGEINRRTGEITYTTEWTPEQNLNEVVSPVKDKYKVDKEKVDTLAVTHESENSEVVVKYSENPEVIDHDESKDKKGTVIVKLVDANGNLLKEETVKNNVTVATATTKVYADRDPETTYTPTNEEYSTLDKKVDTFEKDGKKYKFSKVLEVSDTLGNSIDETGKVKEGTTTVIYQYDYLIPVDPNKPHEGQTNPPSPDDKIPNDPLNRSYKDLGLAKEVTRNITYVYENGPKKGEQVSEPVNQKARFTRTAEINSRTGEVTYTSDWTEGKNLEEVNSPKVEGYFADKEKVETLAVTHESENSEVVVKYKESVTVIEHDVDKDKKGTVIVKLVDINGTVLKETTVKNNVTVATATTKVYADRDPETTYTPTNEEYSIERENTITIDGLTFKLNRLIPVSNELNNSIDESGKVKEGTTTIIYEYKLIIPSNDIVNEKPEFNGGVNPIEPPVVEIPEYNGGVVPLDPPVVEIPEFNGGVTPIEPPVVETPEYNGGVVPLDPPVVEVPEFTGGVNPIDPPVLEVPEYTEPIKPVENKQVEPEKEKVLPNTNSTSVLASLVSSVIGTLGLGYKSKKRK